MVKIQDISSSTKAEREMVLWTGSNYSFPETETGGGS